jgi:adenine deaminase
LLLVVVNRDHSAKPALAFIEGFGLQQDALASSVAHNSHNIIALAPVLKRSVWQLTLLLTHKAG